MQSRLFGYLLSFAPFIPLASWLLGCPFSLFLPLSQYGSRSRPPWILQHVSASGYTFPHTYEKLSSLAYLGAIMSFSFLLISFF